MSCICHFVAITCFLMLSIWNLLLHAKTCFLVIVRLVIFVFLCCEKLSISYKGILIKRMWVIVNIMQQLLNLSFTSLGIRSEKVGGLNINYMWADNFWRKTIFNERQPFIERTFNGFQHWMEVDISSIKTKLWWKMTETFCDLI